LNHNGNLKLKNELGGGDIMATWKCECGFAKEGRCKPQKCEKCGEKGKFVKAE
jgi:rubrerythrin